MDSNINSAANDSVVAVRQRRVHRAFIRLVALTVATVIAILLTEYVLIEAVARF